MKKFLLALAAAATLTGAANAEVITLATANATDIAGTEKDGNIEPLTSLKLGDYTFTFDANGNTSPNPRYWAADKSIRIYAKHTMTIAGTLTAVNGIEIVGKNVKGIDANNMPTVTSGSLALNDKTLTWTPSDAAVALSDITITMPSAKGADGANPNLQFTSVKIYTGSDKPGEGGGDNPQPQPGETGSKENPLTVAQFLAQGTPSSAIANTYVKGYIVGNAPGQKISEAIFTAEGASASNILIAGAADCKDYTLCIPVQLASGTAPRAALNLMDNPGNLGKEVILCGSHEAYFGTNGLKSVTWYQLAGGVDPDKEIDCSTVAELLAVPNGSKFNFAGEAVVSYANGPDCYIFDNTGATLLYSSKNDPWPSVLAPGTIVTSCSGVRSDYKGTVEFIPVMNTLATEEGEGAPYAQPVNNADALAALAVDTYVVAKNVSIAIDEANDRQATITYADGTTSAMWNRFSGSSYNPTTAYPTDLAKRYNVYGLRSVNNGTPQITFVKADDATGIADINVAAENVMVNGRDIIAPAGSRIYTMSGAQVGGNGLASGVYIVRTANKAVKVIVK